MSYRAMAEAIVNWFQNHPQVRISHHNRLLQQCKLYLETKCIIQQTHPDWLFFIQGLKDIQEYWFIIEILREKLLKTPFLKQFTRSLEDSILPRDSGDATPGRDTQFELFLAAIASRAGFTIGRLGAGKADWILTASGRSWSLEAKRIKSLDKMEKHIRKASKQITASNIGGVIAVDISLAINPSCDPLSTFVSDDDIQKAHSMRTNCFIKEYLPSIREWIGSKSIGFLLFFDYVIVPANSTTPRGNSPWGLIGLWQKVDLLNLGTSNKARYDELWSLFEIALPNL
jgi:hypothetical protein